MSSGHLLTTSTKTKSKTMWVFKIKFIDEQTGAVTAVLLRASNLIVGSSYAGGQQQMHTLTVGGTYEIETGALKRVALVPDAVFVLTGSWINYYKLNPPIYTLCATDAIHLTGLLPE